MGGDTTQVAISVSFHGEAAFIFPLRCFLALFWHNSVLALPMQLAKHPPPGIVQTGCQAPADPPAACPLSSIIDLYGHSLGESDI